MPCHHSLAEALHAPIGVAGIVEERMGWLFRTQNTTQCVDGTAHGLLSGRAHNPLARCGGRNTCAECNHSFRATGRPALFGNGGALEHAQSMAAHESLHTTKLYDARGPARRGRSGEDHAVTDKDLP